MTDFIQDGTSLPIGKTDARPLTGLAGEHITSAEWNTVMQALYDTRGKIQLSPGYINVKAFGAVGDGVADDWAAFNAAIESLPIDNKAANTIYVPPGIYRLSRPLHIKRVLRLSGAVGPSATTSGYAGASVLRFDAGIHGVIVHRTTTSPDGGSGEGAVIEHLLITTPSKSGRTHGLTMRAQAFAYRVSVEGFSGDGFHIVAASDMNAPRDFNTAWAAGTVYKEGDFVTNDGSKRYTCLTAGTSAGSGGPTGTGSSISDNTCVWKYVSGCFANLWSMDRCSAVSNGCHGLFVEGDNVNAGTNTGFNAVLNGRWGILDNSFLGNSHSSGHAATNNWGGPRNQVPTGVAAWAPATAYIAGQYVTNGGLGYVCTVAGTSAGSGGPSGTATSGIVDGVGTLRWGYRSIIWRPSAAYAEGEYTVNDSGKTYLCVTAGTSAGSGGPTGTGTSNKTDNTAVWRYVPVIPGPYGANLDEYGVSSGNFNAYNVFLGCYSEQDQAPSNVNASSFVLGGLHAAGLAGGAGGLFGDSLGAYGSSVFTESLRCRLTNINDSTYAIRQLIMGDQLGGGRFFTFRPSDGSADLVFQDQNIFNTKFYSFGAVSLPAYQGCGVAQQYNKIGTRRTPIGQFAVASTYGIFLGTTRVTSLPALPTDGVWGQGIFQNYYAGDVIFNSAVAAGGTAGWVCTASGTTGTYTEGKTATTDGTSTVVLNSATTILDLGNYLTINGVPGYRLDAFGTTGGVEDRTKLVLNTTIAAAGPGLTVGYSAPTFAEFGKVSGGAGDSTGTPGNATLNTQKGRSAIAAGAAAVTITNSRVTSSSIVTAVLQTSDGTLTQLLRVVPGSGSFVITGNANATGNVNVGWFIEE